MNESSENYKSCNKIMLYYTAAIAPSGETATARIQPLFYSIDGADNLFNKQKMYKTKENNSLKFCTFGD